MWSLTNIQYYGVVLAHVHSANSVELVSSIILFYFRALHLFLDRWVNQSLLSFYMYCIILATVNSGKTTCKF